MKTRTQILILCALAAWFSIIGAVKAETVFWSDNFDDGNGDNRWYADRGVWQIGSPTVGPQTNASGSRAHSGTICATTGLSGNYLSGQDSRFIRIASFTVPAADQNPRLRFWHWFSFAGRYCPFNCDEGSYASVDIKVGANNWQQISPTYALSSSAVWTRSSIVLTPYAGQTVQIAFHFHSAAYTDVGWYVDDVAVVTGAPVLNSPEGFELGLGDWYTESGTWEVGVPTSGPPTNSLGRRAYTGTNCAATVLAGNYASSVDSRLVSPAFAVPAASTSPRLRFWHWFSIAGPYCPFYCDEGSYAYVEIRVGTNNWQTVSPTYRNSGSGVWTKPSIDLTPYAGQTNVQIAFHFHSAAYTDVGWYIDDVAVVTGPPVLNNPDGFELGIGDWYAESGTWEVGVPTSGPPTNALGWRAFSGTNCAATVLAGNYASSVDSRFISPTFLVPPQATGPALRFRHWYNFAGAYCPFNCDEGSYGYVEVRAGTNGWRTVSPQYSGQSGAWSFPFINLSPFGGQTVQVAFHFHSAANTAPGWYVDDVRLIHDFGLLLLNSPVVRTQNTACLSLGVAMSSPASAVSFTLQAPADNLSNLMLNTEGCWSGTITPQPSSQWLVTLQNNCTNAPMGVQTIGSICFTAVSTESAFVPFSVDNLVVTNPDSSLPPTHAFGTRAVIIANKPLLEPWLGLNGQRMLTTYGKANTAYEIHQSINATASRPWPLGWTNIVPVSLFTNSPVRGSLSNAPVLFLDAREQ